MKKLDKIKKERMTLMTDIAKEEEKRFKGVIEKQKIFFEEAEARRTSTEQAEKERKDNMKEEFQKSQEEKIKEFKN